MLKLACLVLLCAIVAIQCQDEKPGPKPGEADSHEEQPDSSEEHGGFGKRPPPMHRKNGKGPLSQSGGSNNNNNDDVNVNVNVHIGGGAAQRPQWFGDRSKNGRSERDDYSSEEDEHHGGKRPRPPHPETNESRLEEEYSEWNSSRPDGERPPRPDWNGTRPEDNEHGYHRRGGKYGRGGKNHKGWNSGRNGQDNSDNNDVNVNVNVQVNRGNPQNNYPQQGGRGGRRPQIEGEGGRRPPKPEEHDQPPSPRPDGNAESSSEQTE